MGVTHLFFLQCFGVFFVSTPKKSLSGAFHKRKNRQSWEAQWVKIRSHIYFSSGTSSKKIWTQWTNTWFTFCDTFLSQIMFGPIVPVLMCLHAQRKLTSRPHWWEWISSEVSLRIVKVCNCGLDPSFVVKLRALVHTQVSRNLALDWSRDAKGKSFSSSFPRKISISGNKMWNGEILHLKQQQFRSNLQESPPPHKYWPGVISLRVN